MSETIINYADKYSAEIDERFMLSSVTSGITNDNYDFNGVNKVWVYSSELAELNDYNMLAGTNRYGTPVELGNRVQEMTLTQDKAFTFTIDRRNNEDTMMTQEAGKSLQRHIDELVIPTIDKYRLNKLAENATVSTLKTIAENEPYIRFLEANLTLTEKKVPVNGRVVYMVPDYYRLLRLDSHFVGNADIAANIAHNGETPMIDGAKVIVVPSEYLPKNTMFLITHPSALVSPIKLSEYNVNEEPQGISGWLVEARIYYDAFVLNNKKDAIYLVKIEEQTTDETDTPATDETETV